MEKLKKNCDFLKIFFDSFFTIFRGNLSFWCDRSNFPTCGQVLTNRLNTHTLLPAFRRERNVSRPSFYFCYGGTLMALFLKKINLMF